MIMKIPARLPVSAAIVVFVALFVNPSSGDAQDALDGIEVAHIDLIVGPRGTDAAASTHIFVPPQDVKVSLNGAIETLTVEADIQVCPSRVTGFFDLWNATAGTGTTLRPIGALLVPQKGMLPRNGAIMFTAEDPEGINGPEFVGSVFEPDKADVECELWIFEGSSVVGGSPLELPLEKFVIEPSTEPCEPEAVPDEITTNL